MKAGLKSKANHLSTVKWQAYDYMIYCCLNLSSLLWRKSQPWNCVEKIPAMELSSGIVRIQLKMILWNTHDCFDSDASF